MVKEANAHLGRGGNMGDTTIPMATQTFENVLIEFMELSGKSLTVQQKDVARQASADGQITLDEFRAFGLSDNLYMQMGDCTVNFDPHRSRCHFKPLNIFNIAETVKNLKCKLGTHANPSLCKPEVKIVETKCPSVQCNCSKPRARGYANFSSHY